MEIGYFFLSDSTYETPISFYLSDLHLYSEKT